MQVYLTPHRNPVPDIYYWLKPVKGFPQNVSAFHVAAFTYPRSHDFHGKNCLVGTYLVLPG
jgi:hypothetical protein